MNSDENDVESGDVRAAMLEACIQGYKWGKDVEDVSDISLSVAENRFDRWFKMNFQNE